LLLGTSAQCTGPARAGVNTVAPWQHRCDVSAVSGYGETPIGSPRLRSRLRWGWLPRSGLWRGDIRAEAQARHRRARRPVEWKSAVVHARGDVVVIPRAAIANGDGGGLGGADDLQ